MSRVVVFILALSTRHVTRSLIFRPTAGHTTVNSERLTYARMRKWWIIFQTAEEASEEENKGRF